jgi:hypothetical protein
VSAVISASQCLTNSFLSMALTIAHTSAFLYSASFSDISESYGYHGALRSSLISDVFLAVTEDSVNKCMPILMLLFLMKVLRYSSYFHLCLQPLLLP